MENIGNYKKNIDLIPIYIIEEHHEAFIVWNKAVNDKLISAQDNILFHFDEHDDLIAPSFNRSIHDLKNDFKSVVNFTFKEMGIASFIIPSIYLGLINQYYWFKNENIPKKRTDYNNEGLKLIFGKRSSLPKDVKFNDIKLFKYSRSSINLMPTNKKALLDIDLDFFSCTGNPMLLNDFQIEITQQEYKSFKNNKYHKIYYSGVSRVDAIKRNGNYYKYLYPIDVKKPLDQILERIKIFGQQLKLKNVNPSVITICRSRHSGYAPADQWIKIEKLLLTELSTIYNVRIEKLDYS